MRARIVLISAFLACLAALGFTVGVPNASAAGAAKAVLNSTAPISETANAGLIEIGRRRGRHGGWGRGGRRHFKKHWSGRRHFGHRKHYSRKWRHHKRRHYRRKPFVGFYFSPFFYDDYYYDDYYDYYDYTPYRSRRAKKYSRCDHWRHKCKENWGYKTNDYYGCLKYHKCY